MMEGSNRGSDLPPGFRFHPTDEELIIYYLKNQAMSRPCPVSIIPEVDIYKFDPWELPAKAGFGENEWYFFSPRDRKYPNGIRPNRATRSGYWKATGTDKAIYCGAKYVGIKKALVFYQGRPPKGNKSDWIMHEYRLSESQRAPHHLPMAKQRAAAAAAAAGASMRLGDWVLCRIYKKRHVGRAEALDHKEEESQGRQSSSSSSRSIRNGGANDASATNQDHHQQQQVLKFPMSVSLAQTLDHVDYYDGVPIAQYLLNESNYPFSSAFEFPVSSSSFCHDHGGLFDPNGGNGEDKINNNTQLGTEVAHPFTRSLQSSTGLQYVDPRFKLLA